MKLTPKQLERNRQGGIALYKKRGSKHMKKIGKTGGERLRELIRLGKQEENGGEKK